MSEEGREDDFVFVMMDGGHRLELPDNEFAECQGSPIYTGDNDRGPAQSGDRSLCLALNL